MSKLISKLFVAAFFCGGAYLIGTQIDAGVLTQEDAQILVMPLSLVTLILLAVTGNLVRED